MTDNTKIYDKIRKLLALADATRNSSEAEAALAAERVQSLLQDYGLTLAQVEAAGGAIEQGDRAAVTSDRRALYKWQQALMAALAENNFCLHRVRVEDVVDGRKQRASKRHQLVGRKLNVDVTLQTYDYLAVAIKRAASEAGYEHAARERDHHVFLDGAVTRLVERLAELRRQKERESRDAAMKAQATGNGSGTELVLTDVYGSEADQNNDVINNFPIGTTAAKKREAADKKARIDAKHQELIDAGVDWAEGWYLAHGYSAEAAKSYGGQYNRNARRRSSSSSRGWTRGWRNADGGTAHAKKVNSAAYQSGRDAGNSIGLDTQVGRTTTKRIS